MTDLYPLLAEADFSQPSQQQELPEPLPPEAVRALLNPTEEHQSEAI